MDAAIAPERPLNFLDMIKHYGENQQRSVKNPQCERISLIIVYAVLFFTVIFPAIDFLVYCINKSLRKKRIQPLDFANFKSKLASRKSKEPFSTKTHSPKHNIAKLNVEEVTTLNSSEKDAIIKTVKSWSPYCQQITTLSDQNSPKCNKENRETFKIIDILACDFIRQLTQNQLAARFFVCKKDGHIEGTCTLVNYDRYYKVYDLTTAPKNIKDKLHQRRVKGVGTALMKRIFEICVKERKSLKLDASPVAVGFYKRLNLKGDNYVILGDHCCLEMSISRSAMRDQLKTRVT